MMNGRLITAGAMLAAGLVVKAVDVCLDKIEESKKTKWEVVRNEDIDYSEWESR